MMTRLKLALTRPIVALALAVGPVAMVLGVLAWSGAVSWRAAAIGMLALIASAVLLRRMFRADAAALRDFVLALARGEKPAALESGLSGLGAEMEDAARALNKSWQARHAQLAIEIDTARALLEALPDPVLAVDNQRKLVRQNRAAQALIGRAETGNDLSAAIRDPEVLSAAASLLAAPGARSVEFAWRGPVERILRADLASLPERGADGAMLAIVLHDLTAIKRAERMRADFVANASHELKTPIAALGGFIETLRGPAREDAEARARFLAIMDEQAKRMARLVDDLLSLSRIELDEHTRPDAPVEILQLLRSVIDTLELRARQRGVAVRIDAPGRLPAARGDRDQLVQVFQNLIDNALKYARRGTEVTIGARLVEIGAPLQDGGAAIAVSVADRGEGIAAEHLPRLTERFYRVDSARSRQMGGTGLGLAIVKHIVNRHRGALSIDSEVGQGSVFTVYLPAAPAPALGRPEPEANGLRRA